MTLCVLAGTGHCLQTCRPQGSSLLGVAGQLAPSEAAGQQAALRLDSSKGGLEADNASLMSERQSAQSLNDQQKGTGLAVVPHHP